MPETHEQEEQIKKPDEAPGGACWADDQKKHEYYYDDAHGYEVYSPTEHEDGENVGSSESLLRPASSSASDPRE